MAKESVALLRGKVDVAKIIDELNAALSEEWIAYYQYWTASKMVEGPQREAIAKEFSAHALDELHHADMIMERILELDGVPVLSPAEWSKRARCVYDVPTQYDSYHYLRILLAAEECAMRRYQEIAELTDGKDYVTCDLAKQILADEAMHERDIQAYITDMDVAKRFYTSDWAPTMK